MTADEKIINLFTTRVRQMILQFNQLKKENEELYVMVDDLEKEKKNLNDQLAQMHNDYNSLKMAKMLEVTDGDLETAKAKVAKLIRDVNKCITLLSEK
jgi:peptidoglycan hydrolase CwlO-like protein